MIGRRVADYRRQLRYKVGEFAKLIGISQGSLSDIENQKTKPSADTIAAIVRKTDINPGWLLTGEGPMRKDDYRTGDNRPFPSSTGLDGEAIDYELMWKVVNEIQLILIRNGIDPQEFPHNKKVIMQNLLYSDAMQKEMQIDERYASLLFNLTYCEVCEGTKSKEKWQNKWGVTPGQGLDLEDVLILVKAAPGLKCRRVESPNEVITDSNPVKVPCLDYYRRRLDDGSLILVEPKQEESPIHQSPAKSESQVIQTVSGEGHKVAGRDIIEEVKKEKK